MIKVIIFDLDGTLVDVSMRWYKLHADLSSIYHFRPLPKGKYIFFKKEGIPEKEIIRKTDIRESLMRQYLENRLELIESWRYLGLDKLKDGVLPLLNNLLKHSILILLTKRNNQLYLFKQLDKFKIKKYFLRIIMTKDSSKKKEVKGISDQYSKNSVIFIGDTQEDFEAARQAGILSGLICDGTRSKSFLTRLKPDFLFYDLFEIKFNF